MKFKVGDRIETVPKNGVYWSGIVVEINEKLYSIDFDKSPFIGYAMPISAVEEYYRLKLNGLERVLQDIG
jgi:hypothetical protein